MTVEGQARIVAIPGEKATEDVLMRALAEFAVFTVGPHDGLAEAVERLEPDIILLDAELPGQVGYVVCKQLHAHRKTREIPIVYVAQTAAAAGAFGADADGFLAMDDEEALFEHVSRLLGEQRAQAFLRQAVSQWQTPRSNELTAHELSVLESGGFAADASADPAPIVDTVGEYKLLLDEGLDVSAAAQRLGVTEGRIRQRLTAKPPELYGIRRGKAWVLPAFQFTRDGLVPDIDKVIAHLPPGLNPVAVARFFTLPSAELSLGDAPVSPVAWLSRGGDWEAAAELAEDAGGLA